MSGVFISYRRVDAQGWAGHLSADLAAAYGDVARFFDLASLAPGADFLREIGRSLADARAVLVLIGPHWLELRDEQGARRLDDPNDVVAAEVAQALTLTIPVVPVLLGGAAMPRAAALPERLRRLASLNAISLFDSTWEHDRDRLFAALEAATPLKRRPAVPAAGAVSVAAGLSLSESELGSVTGVRGAAPSGGVDVLRGAVITRVKMGDIVGVETSPSPLPGGKA